MRGPAVVRWFLSALALLSVARSAGAAYPPYVYNGTLTDQCPIWANQWHACSKLGSASWVFTIPVSDQTGASSGTVWTMVPAGPVVGTLRPDLSAEGVAHLVLSSPATTQYRVEMSVPVPTGGNGPFGLSLQIDGASRDVKCTPQVLTASGIPAGSVGRVLGALDCTFTELTLLSPPASNEPPGVTHDGQILFQAFGTIKDKDGRGAGTFLSPQVWATYKWVNQGAPSSSTVTDVDPAVTLNTVSLANKFTVKITGTGFVQGSTVKIGSGGVKVLATRFVSATEVDVDLGDFSDLPNGSRDVEVTNPTGSKATGKDLFFVSSLELSALEINQGVKMDCTTQVPCVADHRTVVRAKVECNASSCPSATATGRLHVFKAGTTTPVAGSPFDPSPSAFSLRPRSQPADHETRHGAEETLNFLFKGDRTLPAGSYDFVFEIAPRTPATSPGGTVLDAKRNLLKRATGKTFKTSPASLDVYVIAQNNEDGTRDMASLARAASTLRFLQTALPTGEAGVNFIPLPGNVVTSPSSSSRGALMDLLKLSVVLQGNTHTTANPAHLLYLARDGALQGWAVSLCSFGTSESTLPNGCPFPATLLEKGYHKLYPRWSALHFVGHDYGFGDISTAAGGWDMNEVYSLSSPLNPPPCPVAECACEAGNFDTVASHVSVPDDYALYDYMVSDFNKEDASWTDRRTWDLLYGRLMSQAPLGRPDSPEAVQDLLLVTGGITKTGAGSFGAFTRVIGVLPAAGTGEYTVELQNASQAVLSSARFDLPLSLVDKIILLTDVPFAVKVAWVASASRVVLKRAGVVLATRNVSASSPTVTVTYPVGGETLSGTASVRWSASDPNGDALTFSVYCSTDSASWLPLALGITGTTFAWDTRFAKGTGTGRIKVVASDGVNEGSATSPGTFTVTSKGPTAVISAPADGAVVSTGTPVALEGAAFDTEDGLLSSSALSFSSSRDGALGTGESVTAAALSAGVHTITLTATDKNGNKATATTSLTVFTPPANPSETAFVPIVLTSGGFSGSYFTSELTLTNRGTTNATVALGYTAAFPAGAGNGTVYESLLAGRQMIVPDAIEYLTDLGLAIPVDGNRGGTLRLRFYGLSSSTAGAATVRTTTAVPKGRAGLSYPAIAPALLTGTAYLCGLRQTANDRSNLALLNVGSETDGNIVLRPTVYSGNPAAPQTKVLPDVTLSPGGFRQIDQVLVSNGLTLTNGYVKVQRVSGTAPFYTYAIINDQVNSDGSFVPPILVSSLTGRKGISLPVAVETSSYTTELIVTNFGSAARTVKLTYVAAAVQAPGNETSVTLNVPAGEQRVIPSFVQTLRNLHAPGIGAAGPTYAGSVFLTVTSPDVSGLFLGGRTMAPGGGGRYGLFYTGVPYGSAATSSAWLYGLQQDALNRSNLAIVNTGEIDASPSSFRVDLYDGDTGALVNSIGGITVAAKGWKQLDSILKTYAPTSTHAYAKVSRAAGTNPFLCYAVVNDGGVPGQRSDDGAFVTMDLAP